MFRSATCSSRSSRGPSPLRSSSAKAAPSPRLIPRRSALKGREGSSEPGDNPTVEDVTSASVHNGLLLEALLLASKQAVENEYGVGAGAEADYMPRIREILEESRRRGGMAMQ